MLWIPPQPAVPVHLTVAEAFPGGRQQQRWGLSAVCVSSFPLPRAAGPWELPGFSLQRHDNMRDGASLDLSERAGQLTERRGFSTTIVLTDTRTREKLVPLSNNVTTTSNGTT